MEAEGLALSRSALRDSGSTRQWRKIRERILRRDGYICQYCGQEADTVDHVIPRRLNGLDTDDNLVSSCRKCNLAKGVLTESEFTEQLRARAINILNRIGAG